MSRKKWGRTEPTGARVLPRVGYPGRNTLVFVSFLAFVVARYVQLGARREILATVRFEFLLGIAVILMISFQILSRPPDLGRVQPILIGISLLFLAIIIQVPFAASPALAEMIFKDRVIKFAFLTFFMAVMIESPRTMLLFLTAFLFSTFYVTQEAVRGLISGGLVWENQGVMRLHGAVPIYAHPNSLAGVAMGSVPFVAFLFMPSRRWWFRGLLLATVATSLICVIYSGSRTGYVGFVAFALWWWFQSAKKGRFLVIAAVVFFAALPVMPQEYIERFLSIGGQEKEGHSKETRLQIVEDAIIILGEHPFGVGVGSFPAARAARFGRIQDTHNLYLEVATNLGVQGLAVFLMLVAFIMASMRRSMMAFRDQRQRLARSARSGTPPPRLGILMKRHDRDLQFLIAVAQAGAGFVLIRMVLGIFGMDLYEVYWWFGTGLALALAGLEVKTARNTAVLTAAAMVDPDETASLTPGG